MEQLGAESPASTQGADLAELAVKLQVDFDKPSAAAVASLSSWIDQQAEAAVRKGSEENTESLPGNAVAPISEKDADIVKQLQACVKDGVDPRSACGQKFTAFLRSDAAQKKAYESIKGTGSTARKAEFRKAWAEREIASRVTIRRSKLEQLREMAGEEGKYMAYDRIVVAEGGLDNPAAIRRATNYVLCAIKKGHPFIEWHSWKKETENLYFEKIRSNIFSQEWSLQRIEEQEVDASRFSTETPAMAPEKKSTTARALGMATRTSAAASSTTCPTTPVCSGTPTKSNETAGIDGSDGASSTAVPKPPPRKSKVKPETRDDAVPEPKKPKSAAAKLKDDAKALLKRAEDLKCRYHQVISTQSTIAYSVKSDVKYEWANNDRQRERFNSVTTALSEAVDSDKFNRFFVTHDLDGVKAMYGHDLTQHLVEFTGQALVSAITNMEAEQARFNRMHISNLLG